MFSRSSNSATPAGQLGPQEFELFREFLKDACGISLSENKQYLVTTRIRRILTDNNLQSVSELIEQLRRVRHSNLRTQVIDAMTTNETFWFRDTYPFEYLKKALLPALQEDKAGTGAIRIWSAACSSGQEPYSISMAVEEFKRSKMGVLRRPVEVVATDLSSLMLERARSGEYDRMTVTRGLDAERQRTFFDEVGPDCWRIKAQVRDRVQFKALNLMEPYIGMGRFDIIFCRNVLIYFSPDLKENILARMHAALKPGGILILGSSEGLAGVASRFDMVHCSPGIVFRAR
jgi:chemotaxis protein methyltransferase CheR